MSVLPAVLAAFAVGGLLATLWCLRWRTRCAECGYKMGAALVEDARRRQGRVDVRTLLEQPTPPARPSPRPYPTR